MIICQECDLRYEVVFHNDALAMAGDRADQHCPRCGSEELECNEEEI